MFDYLTEEKRRALQEYGFYKAYARDISKRGVVAHFCRKSVIKTFLHYLSIFSPNLRAEGFEDSDFDLIIKNESDTKKKQSMERIIVVHPHKDFNLDLKGFEFIDKEIAKFSGRDEDVLVVRSYKIKDKNVTNELLKICLNTKRTYRIINSVYGQIQKEDLKDFIKEGVKIQLLGGIIGQCHRTAFDSIVKYLQENNIHNIEFIIPFDGCYFQHDWADWNASKEHDPAKRFYGVFMDDCGYELAGGESYTLREVITKKFGELEMPRERYRKQIRDGKGNPVVANSKDVHKNITEYFFKYYDIAKYKLHIDKNQLRIII